MSVPGLEKYWQTGTFVTEALTQEALKALDKAKQYNQPFYLYMSHYAIHIPIDKDTRYFEKYKQKGMSDKEAAYASLIEGMDKSLGDIMDWLEKNGEADNTIILFMGTTEAMQPEVIGAMNRFTPKMLLSTAVKDRLTKAESVNR